jgi:iron(II)-dependent oxidoreductase
LSILSARNNRTGGSSKAADGGGSPWAVGTDPSGDVDELIGDHRYCLLLKASDDRTIEQSRVASAWKAMESGMAIIPGGQPPLTDWIPVATQTGFGFERQCKPQMAVETFYVDKYAVTNKDYARFVEARAYDNVDLWAPEILQNVLQFVDQTGCPGPRFWNNGQPPADKQDHPVVGICIYEAHAYANWVGKRLPTSAEWQQAGCWSSAEDVRYPWGNTFDSKNANTWAAQQFDTVAVNEHPDGCTPNGVYQLIGNVWEWIDAPFEMANEAEGMIAHFEQPMAEIRGGAFDTYFESQATCQFRSAQSLWHRAKNIGFRCCIGADQLPPLPDSITCA